ncbi:hypothetical protein [Streptomyces sp. NPDC091371]|uniref:hypothetical protein n=1 Tax=Streptomyces sp. NPDC091371 TaxID=3155303 RepID=UPI0034297A7C
MAARIARAGVALGALVVAVLAGGCGTTARVEPPGRSERTAPADTRPRMQQVAAAWEGSAALKQWREGFHPLGALDWAPPGGFRSEDKLAAVNGHFELRADLPADPPAAAPIRWAGGGELTLPLLSAREAYGQFAQPKAPAGSERPVPVTAVRLGETTVRTSRGQAQVPAWLFTIEGYDTPLAQIAIRPQELPKPPIEPLGLSGGGTARISGHSAGSPDTASFEVTAGHGSCDGGVAVDVLEGTDTVVLAGRILPGKEPAPGQGCDLAMRMQNVTVTLTRPVGDRILIDSESGAPIEQEARRG